MTVGEKLKPASEWGFYDLDKMEYSLVCINSYNLSDKSNPYVTFTGRVYKFENGYKLNWNVSIENGKCIFGSTGNPEKYEIASNDSLVLNGGWDDLTIDERKTISSMPNFVVFVENTGPSSLYATYWYIPYSLIDWNRPIEIDPDSENKNEYRLYLKTN